MNQESTEAVFDLALKTQHENTKRAIILQIFKQYPMQAMDAAVFVHMFEMAKWIDELKLEDTK